MSEVENKNESEKDEKSNKSLSERTSWMEWLVAALGLILVSLSIGYVGYTSITSEDKPPNLIIEVTSIKPVNSLYLVEFKIKNEGDQTASNIIIEGELKIAGQESEKKEITIKYVAPRSEHQGGLIFTENPEQNELTIKAAGYEKP